MQITRSSRSGDGLAWLALIVLATSLARALPAPAVSSTNPAPVPTGDLSFRHEVRHALERGLDWLKSRQDPEGWWSTSDHPAMTGLALLAFQGHPDRPYQKDPPPWMQKAYAYLLSTQHPDGGLHRDKLLNYNTALSMMALLAANQPDYEPVVLKARRFLVSQQADFGEPGKLDNPFDGGIGYGSDSEHSDLSNTLQALEALYYSRQLAADRSPAGEKDLNWQAAIHFIQNCQNLSSYNKAAWVSDDPTNRGGFVYYPGESKAGQETNAATGRVALRSYGSISYAGLLSYIYAQLDRDDPRVRAVFEWLKRNYTLEENPGMGPQGLFYYYHTMAKALTVYGIDQLQLADGQKVNWRRELAQRLINLQKPDGSWINDAHGRWWERDPVLVTAYTVLALEMIHRGL
jgi:squalene-hopene/tetraprenyl-beta-curcumene cyclase